VSIGRKFTDEVVKDGMKHWPFSVVAKPGGRPAVQVENDSTKQQFSAEELSSMVLAKMRETAEQYLNKKVALLSRILLSPGSNVDDR